jgi:hypothetical protein
MRRGARLSVDRGALRERADRILAELNRQPLERPLFVEFSGSPKSGKSSCIDIVAHFFRRLKFRVLAPTEGASKRTPFYLKDDWVAFNTWSACTAPGFLDTRGGYRDSAPTIDRRF